MKLTIVFYSNEKALDVDDVIIKHCVINDFIISLSINNLEEN